MKVLHLLKTNHFSGAENVVCQIVDMMRVYPQYEMVYCSRDGQIRQPLQERNVNFVPLEAWSVKRLREVLREQKPDVIHAHDMGASFLAAQACGRIPLICHIHNNAMDSRGISKKAIAYLLAGLKARHIFWVSKSSYQGYRFHKVLKNKSSVLYNIISIDNLYRRMQEDQNTYGYDIVYLGRLSYPKNPQRLMHVLAKIVEKKPDVKIAIVGRGELEAETKAVCESLKLENNVAFLGFCSNPAKILHDAGLMIMTSRWEGTPMCALEAMALGVPIVSTPTDGLCELVENGQTGYLCDTDDDLAEACLKIIQNPELRGRMSEASVVRSREMNDAQKYTDAIHSVYQKL